VAFGEKAPFSITRRPLGKRSLDQIALDFDHAPRIA
jgi:hypothetical protein